MPRSPPARRASSSSRASRRAASARAEAREATVLHGSPTLFRTLLKARPDGIAGVRTGLVGAPARPTCWRRWTSAGHASSTATASRRQARSPACTQTTRRTRATPQSAASSCVRGAGEPRRAEVQHHLTPGYYRRPEETAHAFHDGWFRTGDLAEIDDNGYVRIVGARRRLFMSAASTSSRPRSRRPCSPIPTSPTPPSSASPTSAWARRFVAYVSQRPGAI